MSAGTAASTVRKASSGQSKSRLLTIDDLDALPDPEWLIRDTLPNGGLCVLYGPPGVGKSFVALDLANSVATGPSWSGHDVKHGDVVYIYAEGTSGLKLRVRAWRDARNKDPHRTLFLPSSINMLDKTEVVELVKEIKAANSEPKMIIVDTLARNFGDGDENSAQDMNAFVRGVDTLRTSFSGATILIVHHSGKDPTKGDRGHSALRGAADVIIRLSKSKTGLRLVCEKQKDASEFEAIQLRLRPVDLGDGKTSCVVEPLLGAVRDPVIADPATAADPRARQNNSKALAALSQFQPTGAAYAEWQKASALKKSTFKDVRKRLVADKRVVKEGRQYWLAPAGPKAETGPEQPLAEAA